jgi:hypothetical protein
MAVGEYLTSILAGGATGLLGTGISRVFSFFENKQKYRQQLELLRINREAAKEESEYRLKEAELSGKLKLSQIEEEGRAASEAGANLALGNSYLEAATRWSEGNSPWMVFVDVLRGVTRPGLTILLCLTAFVMWTRTEDKDLENQIVMTFLYLNTSAVLWWFGSRPSSYNKVR